MYRYMLLFLLFAYIQAADDEKSIVAMTQRLRALEQDVEQKGQCDGERRFVYKEPYEGSVVDDPLPEDWQTRWGLPLGRIRGVMQDYNALPEVDYFRGLGASEQLSDEQKVSEQMVRTPFFDQLTGKERKEKDTVLRKLLESVYCSEYPVGRLFLAASLHIGANVKVLEGETCDVLCEALMYDDIPLVDLALQKGADPNSYDLSGRSSALSFCKSIEAAELMVKHSANVAEASWRKKDLVCCACSGGKIQVLPFYLDYIPPSESNDFGRAWMEQVWTSILVGWKSAIVERVEILLEHGCQYDEETKNNICAYVAQNSPELKERIERAFANAEIKKDIKG